MPRLVSLIFMIYIDCTWMDIIQNLANKELWALHSTQCVLLEHKFQQIFLVWYIAFFPLNSFAYWWWQKHSWQPEATVIAIPQLYFKKKSRWAYKSSASGCQRSSVQTWKFLQAGNTGASVITILKNFFFKSQTRECWKSRTLACLIMYSISALYLALFTWPLPPSSSLTSTTQNNLLQFLYVFL